LLANGKVLVAGGRVSDGYYTNADRDGKAV